MLLELSLAFTPIVCASCNATNGVDAKECTNCRADLTPLGSASSLQHIRLATHQATVAEIEQMLVAERAGLRRGNTPVDVQQYLNFISGSDILSDDHVELAIARLSQLELGTRETVHKSQSYRKLQELCRAAQNSYDVYRSVVSIAPPPDFEQFHTLLVVFLSAVLDIYLYGTRALFALNTNDAHQCQRDLQKAADECLESASALQQALAMINTSPADTAEVRDRLRVLTGQTARYSKEDVDLGEVLRAALHTHGSLDAIARAVYPYIADLLESDLPNLSEDHALSLLAMSKALVTADNVVTIKRRVRIFVEVLRRAAALEPAAILSAGRQVIPEVLAAEDTMLTVREQLNLVDTVPMSRDARRMQLKNAYIDIAEGVWRRLVSLVVYAMFVLEGSDRSYDDVSNWAGFGEKVQWLLDRHNPQYAIALEGISSLTRNAGAHGGIDVSGERIVFRNINMQTRHESSEELSDDEFIARIHQMIETCLILRTASDVFFLEHWETFRSDLASARPRTQLVDEIIRTSLGVWDLTKAQVERDEDDLYVQAQIRHPTCQTQPSHFSAAFIVFASQVPTAARAVLTITHEGQVYCRLTADLDRIREIIGTDDSVRDVMTVLLMYAVSSSTPVSEPLDEQVRYRGTIAFNIAHHVMLDVADLGAYRGNATVAPNEYLLLLGEKSKRLAAYKRVVRRLPAPTDEMLTRNKLLSILDNFEKGIRMARRSVSEHPGAPLGPNERLTNAGMAAIQLRDETYPQAETVTAR